MSSTELIDLQALLEKVFEFSQEDIKANEKGHLSETQRNRIKQKHYANCRLAWIAFGLIFGVGFLGFSVEMIRTEKMGTQTLAVFFGVTAFFALIIWLFIMYYRRQMKRTLLEGKVEAVQGPIRIISERVEKLFTHYFCIGNYKFAFERHKHFKSMKESGIEGRQATLYVSIPWQGLQSVQLST